MHEHLIKWLSDIIKKKTERGVPHMLAPRRGCLDYSNVYCDVRKRCFLTWNQNRHITYYILHIQYTNSEISICLLYIRSHFVWWKRLNQCAAPVRNLPTSILVRASLCLSVFHTHTSTFFAPLCFTNFEGCRLQTKMVLLELPSRLGSKLVSFDKEPRDLQIKWLSC